jgi:N-hydroxyarylamine O-acetyltransferase
MGADFDLNGYFERIGFGGSCVPSLETLCAIHRRHAETIPFENLDPFLRRPVLLDAASIQRKLVFSGRGGYCFEQNLLLSGALKAIGFAVTGLAARVLWNATGNAVRPRSHMLLLVQLEGTPYLADVGFGGQTLTGPLRLEADIEQATPHEPFCLRRSGEAFELYTRIGEDWKPLYRFDLQEQFLADYEVSSWYLSNHPESPFVTQLIAARPDRGCRYALHNTEFAIHHVGGKTEQRTLVTVAELHATLRDIFRIALPATPETEAALSRLVAQK